MNDGESVEKFVLSEMVEKLNLQVEKKATPYQLTWVHNRTMFIIREQCLVSFSLRKFKIRCFACDLHDSHAPASGLTMVV